MAVSVSLEKKRKKKTEIIIFLLLINLARVEVISICLYVTFLYCVTEDHFIRCYGPSLLAGIPLNCCRGKNQNWSLEHLHCFSGELKQNLETNFLKINTAFGQNYCLQKVSLSLLRGCTLHCMVRVKRGRHEYTTSEEDRADFYL